LQAAQSSRSLQGSLAWPTFLLHAAQRVAFDAAERRRKRDAEKDEAWSETVAPALLTFEDVRSTLPPPKGKAKDSDPAGNGAEPAPRVILDGVTGQASPGRLLAVRFASASLDHSFAMLDHVPSSSTHMLLCWTLTDTRGDPCS
jgi:hypothetical protein